MDTTSEIRPGIVLAGRFRVRGRLGRGGTATVFLAEDCVLRRDVAIKRLHAEGSETDARRFQREARLGASLTHPNLVTVFDTLASADGLLIVMEYVRGRPLADLIPPGGMDPGRLLEILRPIASALDHAHDHGIVHRDVKPANILIGEDGQVRLVDLGTATAGHVTQITGENEVLGTLAYIAPERLSGDSVGEPAADVYSLAVVAFEGLTGRPPHRATTPVELLEAARGRPVPNITEAWPQAPPGLADALARGMDPDPERRQQSAGELVGDLEAAAGEPARERASRFEPTEPMAPPEPQPESPQPGRPRPFEFEFAASRRRPRWLLPGLAAAIVLAGIGVWLALAGGGGGGGASGGPQAAAHGHDGGPQAAAADGGSTTPGATSEPAAGSAAAPATSDASGAELNAEGYSLIQQGRYAEAIPVLRRAVASFPPGTTDINYAYALYNLGHALRMNGQPQAAVPILEQRLRIPNQTATVRRELEAARAEAAG